MLDKEEFDLCRTAMNIGKSFVENEIKKRNIKDYEWLESLPRTQEKHRYFTDMYRVLTGFPETNPLAIWHHTLDNFGPDCPSCKKPLRTINAKYCVECGYGKEEIDKDSRPLIERKSNEFR